jgi:ankyrin repeat protein
LRRDLRPLRSHKRLLLDWSNKISARIFIMADQEKLNQLLVRESQKGHTEIVKVLLDACVDVHAKKDMALRFASENGHTEVVKLLLEAGADVHAVGDGALYYASRNGHTETVKLLLDKGADVHSYNYEALRAARDMGHTETVTVLEATAMKPPVLPAGPAKPQAPAP